MFVAQMKFFDRQQAIKLDATDRKLFWYLCQDARMPKTTLARKLRISPSLLQYKIARLERLGAVVPTVILDLPALGINSYFIFLDRLGEKEAQRILSNDIPFTVMRTIGQYQYVLHIITNEIDSYCKKHLPAQLFDIHPVQAMYPDNFNGYHVPLAGKPLRTPQPVQMDRKDYALLHQLTLAPTAPVLQLGKALRMDPSTVKKRMQSLERAGIIQFFRVGANVFDLGFLSYVLHVRIPPGEKRQLLHRIREDHYSGFVYETLTGYIFYYYPEHHSQLLAFISTLEQHHPSMQLNVIQNVGFYALTTPKPLIEHLLAKATASPQGKPRS